MKKWKDKKCLVLGGTGFIGKHVVRALLKRGQSVRVLSRVGARSVEEILWTGSGQVEFMVGDLTDSNIVHDTLDNCKTCIHLAGTTIPSTSNEDKIFDIQSNLVATVNFLEAAKAQKIEKLVYISSGGAVYGDPQYTPLNEVHPTNPKSSYGITKLAIEKYFQLFGQLYGMNYVVLRVANPYGPGQRTDLSQGAIAVFLSLALRNFPIEIWGDGKSIRDYLYVEDAAAAILAALNYVGNETVFNVGSGVGTELNAILSEITVLLDRQIEVKYSPARSIDVKVNVLNIEKAAKHLDWRPIVSLHDGLARTLHSMQIDQISA